MLRRAFLLAAIPCALVLAGCKSKAQRQAEIAVGDADRLGKIVADRHVDALSRALPKAADALAAKLGDKADVHADTAALGAAFVDARNKTDDLRSAKRSYYVITDDKGEIAWVDDDNWLVVGRKLAATFAPVKQVLEGAPYATGSGRYGGAAEDALSFVEAAPIKKADKTVGALVAVWEAHEAAEDLQRQLATELAMKSVQPKTRVKPKDKRALQLDAPDVWVAVFHGKNVYFQEDAPQPLEDATKALDLAGKTSGGAWHGTYDVMNKGWGAAAKRLPALGPDVGVAVLRLEP